MIRRFEYKDLDQIMSMWLHTVNALLGCHDLALSC